MARKSQKTPYKDNLEYFFAISYPKENSNENKSATRSFFSKPSSDIWHYFLPGQTVADLPSARSKPLEHVIEEKQKDIILSNNTVISNNGWVLKRVTNVHLGTSTPPPESRKRRLSDPDTLEESQKKIILKHQQKKETSKGVMATQETSIETEKISVVPSGSKGFRVEADILEEDSTAPEIKADKKPPLTKEQNQIYQLVVYGQQNLFFTGSAGTGKSVLLREIISTMTQLYGDSIAVTASTGIAAFHIGGTTLHSFAGVGLGQKSVGEHVAQILNSQTTCERWRTTKTLIIDEISMIDGCLLDKLEEIARRIRGNNAPFGGIQIVLSGDFFQLPPVNEGRGAKFAFEAGCWKKIVPKTFILNRVFRQKNDMFVNILNEMRIGKLSNRSIGIFRRLARNLDPGSGIQPTELYPIREQVDRANSARLESLRGKIYEFRADDRGNEKMLGNLLVPKVVRLKKDCQVMLLKNIDKSLVNGSIGIVIGFVGDSRFSSPDHIQHFVPASSSPSSYFSSHSGEAILEYPIVRFTNNRVLVIEQEKWTLESSSKVELASRKQIPLMLAWAMSIHKSQGQTLECVKVDLGRAFENGQVYVAISRAVSLESLQVLNFDPNKIQTHHKVTQFYKNLKY